jgi:circadian clock protein KaiC
MRVTAVLTAERSGEYDAVARFDVEQFVADNVVVLRYVLEHEKRRRTIEVLKLRGAPHRSGQWLYTIDPRHGIVVLPLAFVEPRQRASTARTTTGLPGLDGLCGGGLFPDSIVFVSGPTGTGKTLLATHFAAGVALQERSLFFSFEESRDQVVRNASSWGFDIEAMEDASTLSVMCQYPELASLEDHFLAIKQGLETVRPSRLVIDNLSALDRVASASGLRGFLLGVASMVKSHAITTMFTGTTSRLFGTGSGTEADLSTLTDSIVLLRYVELAGEMRRSIAVLKHRGSVHDRTIREFTIDGHGMHIGERVRGMTGVLAGHPVFSSADLQTAYSPERDERTT